jgi:intracellular septation protein
MRTLLVDMAAGLLFFAVLSFTNDIYWATLAGVVFGVGVATWIWMKTRRLEPMQLLGVGLVLLMGSATIMLHDPRFMMYKPTVYFICLSLVMSKPGWMYRYMPKATTTQELPAASIHARRRFIVVAGAVYCGITLGMALLNAALNRATEFGKVTLCRRFIWQDRSSWGRVMRPWLVATASVRRSRVARLPVGHSDLHNALQEKQILAANAVLLGVGKS